MKLQSAKLQIHKPTYVSTVIHTVLYCIVILVLFMRCRDVEGIETRSISSKFNSVQSRGGECEPGTITYADGRIKFPTFEDFKSTVDFLNCATQSEIDEWCDGLEIETAKIAMKEFFDATCCDTSITVQEYEEIEEEFENRVMLWVNGSGEKEVSLKYDLYPEFVNVNGEFQVDSTFVKIAGNNIISVTDTSLVDIKELDEETETNSELGLYVSNTEAITLSCPSNHEEIDTYDGNKKRFKIFYEIQAGYIVTRPAGQVRFQPGITVYTRGVHQSKRSLIWWCSRINFDYEFEITFEHNWDSYFSSPLTFEYFHTATDKCEINANYRWNGTQSLTPLPAFESDVAFVTQTMTKVPSGPSGHYDCED